MRAHAMSGWSVTKTLATPWMHAGGSPAATPFLLLRQKKVSKEKATAKPLPSLRSGPQMWRVSVGWKDQLATLKHVFPQFPTDTRHIWQRPNAEFTSTATATSKTTQAAGGGSDRINVDVNILLNFVFRRQRNVNVTLERQEIEILRIDYRVSTGLLRDLQQRRRHGSAQAVAYHDLFGG
ncbi:hypothetical protein [Collimonas sp.]|jgi:hypothetical protein|uniref:hypothetical protein n=1 Tax=Collimonas sp. TaxID=1963772 RepID=UPI002B68CDDD|nr:hypothetical protein [Collimonas sp.]HWW07373.1 hypothetical protein [Collimonas sp.]